MVRSRLCHWLIGFSWAPEIQQKKSDPSVESQGIPGFLGVWAKEFNKKTVIQMWLMAFRELSSTSRNLDLLKVEFFSPGSLKFHKPKKWIPKGKSFWKKKHEVWGSSDSAWFSTMCFSDTVALFCWDSLQKTCHDPPTISSSTAIASFWFKRRPQGPCVWRQCWWKLSSATQTAL